MSVCAVHQLGWEGVMCLSPVSIGGPSSAGAVGAWPETLFCFRVVDAFVDVLLGFAGLHCCLRLSGNAPLDVEKDCPWDGPLLVFSYSCHATDRCGSRTVQRQVRSSKTSMSAGQTNARGGSDNFKDTGPESILGLDLGV